VYVLLLNGQDAHKVRILDNQLKAKTCPICKYCGWKKFKILRRSEKEIVLQCLACHAVTRYLVEGR
jgi:RNase P subunit RPR2